MNVNTWIIGMFAAVAPSIAVAGPGVPLGTALGTVLGAVLGTPLGAIVPIASGGLLVVAAALVTGICIVRRKRQR